MRRASSRSSRRRAASKSSFCGPRLVGRAARRTLAALKTPCYLRYSKNYKKRHAPQWELKYVNDLVMYNQPLVVEDQAAYDARVREIGEDGLIVLGVVSLMDGDGQACEAALFSSDSISPCEAVA